MAGSSENNIMYHYSGEHATYIDIPHHTDTYTYDACDTDVRISELAVQLSALREEMTLLRTDKDVADRYNKRLTAECTLGHQVFDRMKEAMERAAARLHTLSKLRDLDPEDADLHRYNMACMKVDQVKRNNVILLMNDKITQTAFKPFIPGSLEQVLQLNCTTEQFIVTIDYDSVADCLVVDDGCDEYVLSADLNTFEVLDMVLLKTKDDRWDSSETDDTTNFVMAMLRLPVRVLAQSRTCISAEFMAKKFEPRTDPC